MLTEYIASVVVFYLATTTLYVFRWVEKAEDDRWSSLIFTLVVVGLIPLLNMMVLGIVYFAVIINYFQCKKKREKMLKAIERY